MEQQATRHRFTGTRALILWASWILGPLAWAVHQNVSYFLAATFCEQQTIWMLHLVTAATLAVAAVGGLIGWYGWRHAGPRQSHDDRIFARSRFLAAGGMLLSAICFMGILVEGIPNYVLDPCLGIP